MSGWVRAGDPILRISTARSTTSTTTHWRLARATGSLSLNSSLAARLPNHRSLSGLLSRMRCWPNGDECEALGAANSLAYSQAGQRCRRAVWPQPGGTGRLRRIRDSKPDRLPTTFLTPAPAQLPDRSELRHGAGQFAFGAGNLLFRGLVLQSVFRCLFRGDRLRFIEIVSANRGVSEHGDHVGLDLQEASLDEDDRLLLLAGNFDTHLPRPNLSDQRNVLWVDAQLTEDARENDELGVARVDRLFRADNVDVNRIGHAYCTVFAFSAAS